MDKVHVAILYLYRVLVNLTKPVNAVLSNYSCPYYVVSEKGPMAIRGIPRRRRHKPPHPPPTRRTPPLLLLHHIPHRRRRHRLSLAAQLRIPAQMDVPSVGITSTRRGRYQTGQKYSTRKCGTIASAHVGIC